MKSQATETLERTTDTAEPEAVTEPAVEPARGVAPEAAAAEEPSALRILVTNGKLVPQTPQNVAETGVSREMLLGLTLKLANTVPQFTTAWMSDQLRLSVPVVNELLDELVDGALLEGLGARGFLNFRYRILGMGHERAVGLARVCMYAGAAPVPLESYVEMVRLQNERQPPILAEQVEAATSDLVLDEDVRRTAGIAVSSGRSLFMFGPAGNGKSTLGGKLHTATDGSIWIPRCINVGNQIIQLFDPKWHEPVEDLAVAKYDQRWVRIRRPLITVGGELSPTDLELAYDERRKIYEAPLHLKANGGTFFVDDFGRQRAETSRFLDRWIVPLENASDILTTQTGDKIQVPFQMMLIVATNLDPQAIVDPAYLRRMGYRILLSPPTPEQFTEIFNRYAEQRGLKVPEGMVEQILERLDREGREPRCCHPRDLIERMKEACGYVGYAPELTFEALEVAWTGYFGNWNDR